MSTARKLSAAPVLAASLVLSLAAALPSAGPASAAVPTCATAGTIPSADFNGDSFADLVVSDPSATVGTAAGAGAVEVRYGTAAGQGGGTAVRFSQGTGGAAEVAEPNDGFGGAVAWGLLDGDFCADLVVGVPNEDIGTVVDSGLVEVVWGSAAGLGKGRAPLLLRPGLAGLGGAPATGDRLGTAVALTTFDGLALPAGTPRSLAMGAPGRTAGGFAQAGEVEVVTISSAGAATDPRQITQASAGVAGNPATGNRFGAALDFGLLLGSSQNWREDLLVGAPGTAGGAGAVVTVFDRGASPYAGQAWTQDTAGIGDLAEPGDGFGSAVSTIVDAFSGTISVAIGAPTEDVGSIADAGMVHVLTTGEGGTVGGSFRDHVIHQNTTGVEDVAEAGDRFGSTIRQQHLRDLATFRALLVGVPFEDVGTVVDAGGVALLSEYELGTFTNDRFVTAASTGMPGDPQRGAHLGTDIRGRGFGPQGELLIGMPDSTTWPTGAVARLPLETLFGRSTRAGAAMVPPAGGVRYGRLVP